MKPLLARLADGGELSESDSAAAFDLMMQGVATPAQTGALLMAMRLRGETVAEITGAARSMRAHMLPVQAPPGAVDCVGTGGDGAHTLNISTAASLVIAACGIPVAKHGNRALSSRTGSADVLAALGVNIDAPTRTLETGLRENNIAFLMAPRHHGAMGHVAGPRRELGTRTIFNILGPLANPASVKRQIVGVFSPDWLEPMARVLGNLGAERVWIMHGSGGLDEITTLGPTRIAALEDGVLRRFEVSPAEAGLPPGRPDELRGGTAAENAAALTRLLDGAPGTYRDTVLLTSAAALVVAGAAPDLGAGVTRAAQAIDRGDAAATLSRMVAISWPRAI